MGDRLDEPRKFEPGDSVRFVKSGIVAKVLYLVIDKEDVPCYYLILNPDDKAPEDFFPGKPTKPGDRLAMIIPVEEAERPGWVEKIPR